MKGRKQTKGKKRQRVKETNKLHSQDSRRGQNKGRVFGKRCCYRRAYSILAEEPPAVAAEANLAPSSSETDTEWFRREECGGSWLADVSLLPCVSDSCRSIRKGSS